MPTTTVKSELVRDARNFARKTAKKRKLQRQLDALDEELKQLGEFLSEAFLVEGVSSIKTTHGTCSLREETWPALVVPDGMTKDEARAEAVRTLQAMGRDDLVTYNHISMRSVVKELMDEDGELPPPLGLYVRAEVKHRVGVRGAKEGRT